MPFLSFFGKKQLDLHSFLNNQAEALLAISICVLSLRPFSPIATANDAFGQTDRLLTNSETWPSLCFFLALQMKRPNGN